MSGINSAKTSSNNKIKYCDYTINQDDLFLVGDSELDNKGLVYHHISSSDDLYDIGIHQIITQVFKVEKEIINQRNITTEDKSIKKINVCVTFDDVFISKPTTIDYYSGKEEVIYPNRALLEEKTYSGNLRVNATIVATAYMHDGSTKQKTDSIKNFKICKLPISVKSKVCNLHGLSKEALMQINEDPIDPGGYYIIKGVGWVIDSIENILFNQIRIFKNEGYGKEIIRVELVSKPGDAYQNSEYLLLKLLNDEQLLVDIMRNQLKGVQIPFYLVFRLLGWTTDKEIYDNIIIDYYDNTSKNIINFLNDAMEAKYNIKGRYLYKKEDILIEIIKEMKNTDFKYLELDINHANYDIAFNKIYNILDNNFLPHIGTKPTDRLNKLRYFALIIRKIYLVRLDIIEPTNRDSYKCKRIHASGTSYAKSFKTYFNASIVQQIKRRIIKDFKSMPFSQIDLASTIRSSIYGADFERSIIQTITSGNKSQITINKKTKVNRLSSQLLDRKNQIAAISTLRQITTTTSDSSKQSERANEMRRVHMSFLGYICCIHSSDGEKVGINKQLAIFANILGASSSVVLKDILVSDNEIILLNDADHNRIAEEKLKNVYINGEWIGFTKDTIKLVNKYRKMRRSLKIHPHTTIHWNIMENEVYFWVDVGRISRPLLIVYNNKRDSECFPNKKYSPNNFIQGLKIDTNIINKLSTKKIDITYLLENNVIEYITAEEQENCYVCPFYDQLESDKNNELKEYTHCDIPQSILGITGLTGPFANHNNAPRITFQGNQCRQTCGVFALNWPFRCDKDTFLQYLCETPLVKTVATKYILPNGTNTIVAIACYSGYNQEDSIVVSKGAIDRGLFNGCKFTFIKSELEQREEFANPDETTTLDIKSGSYAKIHKGIISKGTKITNNDIIIGKTVKLNKTHESIYTHMDKSVVYKSSEDALVHNVITDRNDEDEKFVKVCIRKNRPVAVGDKFSVKGTSQVLTNMGWVKIKDIDYRYKIATMTKDGYLDYVAPSGISKYTYDGDMYVLETSHLKMCVTKNHKLYVKPINSNKYDLYETYNVINKKVRFKKNTVNIGLHKEFINLNNYEQKISRKYYMIYWLKLFGMFILCGDIEMKNTELNKEYNIIFNIGEDNVIQKNIIVECLYELDIEFNMNESTMNISGIKYPEILYEFTQIKNDKNNISLPDYIWDMSQTQCQILLNTLLSGNGINKKNTYYTSNISFANEISRLSLHAGWSSITIKNSDIDNSDEILSEIEEYNKNNELYCVKIDKIHNEPYINYDVMDEYVNSSDDMIFNNSYDNSYKVERYEKFRGDVYCLEIPDTHLHIYYSREDDYSPACWTGNSSRHGQKGVTGILLRDSDMPFTEDGIKPCLIINPHAIPSRMTIGQLYEMQASHYCAAKGTHIDATIFKKVDIEQMGNELEAMGYNRYGYHRLYSGITGEYIDSLIFMGPTYYQRLQKFVIDSIYSIGKGPSDVLTRQPLDGKSSGGGLRIGEMERDVLCSHGAAKVIHEKYFEHSDMYKEYICRCGKPAIVNIDNNMYKCKYCKDNADIAEVQTSWSSKLFMQELDSMNIGVSRQIEPFTYENITLNK